MPTFVQRSRLLAPAARVFAWHERPGAVLELVPPWERVAVERAPASLRDGEEAVLRIRLGPFSRRWVARHEGYRNLGELGGSFTDVMVQGPFSRWVHTHRVSADGVDACWLEDSIEYDVPFGVGWLVRRRLERTFAWRHEVTRREVEG